MCDIVIGSAADWEVTLLRVNDGSNSPFIIDEYFVIEDKKNNNPICRVVDTNEVYIQEIEKDLDKLAGRLPVDFKRNDWIYVAKAQIQTEIIMPIMRGAKIHSPNFDEISSVIYTCDIDKGLALGELRGTESLHSTIPENFKNICPMLKDNRITPQSGAPYIFDFRKMDDYPNIGFFGGSGSGKTYAMKSLIEQFIKIRYPAIIFDPHYEMTFNPRKDIVENFDYSKNVKTFVVGENIGIDFSSLTSENLINILKSAGDLSYAMEAAIRAIHNSGEAYIVFQSNLQKYIEAFSECENIPKKASAESWDIYNKNRGQIAGCSTLQAISWRVKAIENMGIFSSDIQDVLSSLNKRKLCVIRGPIDCLNIVGAYLITECHNKRREYIDDKTNGFKKQIKSFLPFVIIMDEAHCFAPANNDSPMSFILEKIAKEGRKYGMFEIMATQRPKLMNKTIIAQLATKFIFRTMTEDDIRTIGQESNLSGQNLKRLPNLSPGACFVSSAISGGTMSIKFRANMTIPKNTVSVFDEINTVDVDEESDESKVKTIIKSACPFTNKDFINIISKIKREEDIDMSVQSIKEIIAEMIDDGLLKVNRLSLGETYNLV